MVKSSVFLTLWVISNILSRSRQILVVIRFRLNKYLGIFNRVPIFLNIQTIAQKYCLSIKLSWFCEKYLQKTLLILTHFCRFRRETEKSQTETGIHFGSRPTINIFRGWKRPEPKNQEKNQRISKEAFIGSAWSTLGCPRRNESQRRGTYFFNYQFFFRFISWVRGFQPERQSYTS